MNRSHRSRVVWAAVLAQLAVVAVAASTVLAPPNVELVVDRPEDAFALAQAQLADSAVSRSIKNVEHEVAVTARFLSEGHLPLDEHDRLGDFLDGQLMRAGQIDRIVVSHFDGSGIWRSSDDATQLGPEPEMGVDARWFRLASVAVRPIRSVLPVISGVEGGEPRSTHFAVAAPVRFDEGTEKGKVQAVVMAEVEIAELQLSPVTASGVTGVALVSETGEVLSERGAPTPEGDFNDSLRRALAEARDTREGATGRGVVALPANLATSVRFTVVDSSPGWRLALLLDGAAMPVSSGGDHTMWFGIIAAIMVVALSAATAAGSQRWMRTAEARATTDELTGLPNRRDLLERLEQKLDVSRRSGRPMSVAMLDCDKFKSINDGLGHHAGDEVLIALAGRLRRSLAEDDLVGRLGGDEFVVVLPDTELAGAVQAMGRVRDQLSCHPVVFDRHEVPVEISVGVAQLESSHDVAALLDAADLALLTAKREGRNRVVAHSA